MKRALRRHQAQSHMMRRVHEDRNQHYNDLSCACYQPGKRMAQFKEQPKLCSAQWHGCGNPRRGKGRMKDRLTVQERRFAENTNAD